MRPDNGQKRVSNKKGARGERKCRHNEYCGEREWIASLANGQDAMLKHNGCYLHVIKSLRA
jgi:hypothetical protein